MPQRNINVMSPIAPPTQKLLREAVAKVIRRVQHENDLTDEGLADELGISIGTVRNGRNETADLNAATIARIGHKFGAEVLDPYSALWGARNVPIETADIDALPSMTAAIHRIALAQSPDSCGGVAITHRELLDMLPELRSAVVSLNSLIVRAEKVAA